MARTPQLQTARLQFGGSVFVVTDSTLVPFEALVAPTFPVPGFGFDFAHLAAVTRNVKVSDISVLSTAQRLALARSLTPVVPFTVPLFPTEPQVIVVQQPAPVVVVQQPALTEEVAEPAARPRHAERRESIQPVPAGEAQRDVGEFLLVRLDGRIVFAVAFSTQGDQLTYVTRDGVRRSLRLSDLDIDATRRMNEERGTTIHLPA